jgi:hypothetical protein
MRIFAASFMTRATAVQALDALDRWFDGSADVRIAALGHAGGGTGPTMVLAGRFGDDVMAAVRIAVAELGGTVVVDRDDGNPHG